MSLGIAYFERMTCKISPKMTFLKVEYDMCVYVDKYVDYVEKNKKQ